MKAKIFLSAIAASLFLFTSCSKDDNNDNTTVVPVATDGFSWSENGSATVKTAATSNFYAQYKTLNASDAAGKTLFEVNLSGTTAGTYTIGTGNAFTYALNPYFTATGGNVIITSNTGGKISGNFKVTGNSSGITAVEGKFTNITVQP